MYYIDVVFTEKKYSSLIPRIIFDFYGLGVFWVEEFVFLYSSWLSRGSIFIIFLFKAE